MKPLSEEQKAALTDYLSRKPKKCKNCGGTDWEFGEIEVVAADLIFSDSQKVKPSPGPFVEVGGNDTYWTSTGVPRAESSPCSNGAGIDLADGTFSALGLTGNARIQWRFRYK